MAKVARTKKAAKKSSKSTKQAPRLRVVLPDGVSKQDVFDLPETLKEMSRLSAQVLDLQKHVLDMMRADAPRPMKADAPQPALQQDSAPAFAGLNQSSTDDGRVREKEPPRLVAYLNRLRHNNALMLEATRSLTGQVAQLTGSIVPAGDEKAWVQAGDNAKKEGDGDTYGYVLQQIDAQITLCELFPLVIINSYKTLSQLV